ncbi:uncharacterized protein LOC109947270 [Prunus persica]|uniref:uncharacterized protein LOC109947270 n=1 Tax=Prunus persica TaxID=3760 RepID=UPI0009AB833A|nr:uncharacterized protein LOC109947270 [Prunus persica]
MARSATAQSHSTHDPSIDIVTPLPLTTVPPTGPPAETTAPATASESSFKELTYVFTKEYTSYRTIKKNHDHLYNLRKKSDESLRDYIKRFKAEKANIVGRDDQIASSAFKKGLSAEHNLYRELTITPGQTLAKVYATVERYALWDDDRIIVKKSIKPEDQLIKQADQRSDGFSNRNKDKHRSQTQGDVMAGENYTKFIIPIHQILAQVKNKPWVRRPPPLKGDPDKRDTSKYCAFHGTHGHTTNNCFAWKTHLEELVREGHCTEFIAKQAIQRIEDRDTAKEPPQKVIRISTILADSEESGLTSKEKKRKIKQATVISQITTDLPPAEDDPVIGFQKKDLIDLDMPHNDALVISIQIAQAMVDRIHADEGSAANILQLAVIQQMGLETKINKLARLLTSFNGATTVTMGTIDLDVYSPPQSKRHDQAEEIRPEVFPEEGWKPEEDVELIPLDPDQPDRKVRIGSRLSPEEKVELTTFLRSNKDMFAWLLSDMLGIDSNIICH